jgi:hypothetical protein
MSFINFNNKSELYEGKYSARVIAEALYSVETKNTKKIEATLSSVKEPVAISEALKFFSNKINALSALQVAKTNALPVNEGQFSWMTQDTGEQIGSEKENRITVYMYDNEGNQWKEDKYDGYGEFGGMDYYELLAKMNGYSEEDLEEVKGPFKEMRQLGIDLAFGKLKTKDKGRKVLFPALVEDPRYNWKRHNFTQEPESDPNQSWYVESDYDDEYDDEYYEAKTNEAKIVISKEDMAKLHKEGKVEINGNVIEFVEEGLSWDSLIEKINEEDLNERSINKIQKDWAKVTADMKDAVSAWKSAEGVEKEKMLAKLKELTAKKKSLEAELNVAVGLKDADAELVGEAAMQEIDKKVQKFVIKNANDYDYSNQDSAFQIYLSLKKLYPKLIKESVVTEGKNDFMARYGSANINLKKGYKHHTEEELNDLYDKLGDLVKTLRVKDVTLVFESAVNEDEDYSDEMSYGQLENCIDNANMIRERIEQGTSLDPWMHSQIAVAKNDLTSVFDALDGDDGVVEAMNPKISLADFYEDNIDNHRSAKSFIRSAVKAGFKESDVEDLLDNVEQGGDSYAKLSKDIFNESIGVVETVTNEAKISKMSTEHLKKMIKQAEDERVSPSFAMQIKAARAELKKRGESMVESSVVTEAKTLDRDEMMIWLEDHLGTVRTSEEFDGAQGGIWVSGENGDVYKGKRIYDYYNEDSRKYNFGVLVAWEKELNKRGWYSEWYDAGTVMIWPN